MKKILTIAATALLSAIAGAAHADTVNFPATVASSCTLSTPVDGTFTIAPTALTTNAAATVKVTCNGSTSNLALTAGTNTIPTQTPAPTVAFNFSGGTGIFATSTLTSAALTDATASSGDTANISASVTAGSGKLLKAGGYNVAVIATITP